MPNFNVISANWAFNTRDSNTVAAEDVTAIVQSKLNSSNIIECHIDVLGDPGEVM